MRGYRLAGVILLLLAQSLAVTAAGGETSPAPLSHGPFPVGFSNVTVPQAGPGGAAAPATIFYPSTTGGDGAPSDTSLAPWTTIEFAPGYGATRLDYWSMLVSMASGGTVVIGVDYNPGVFVDTADMAFRVGYTLDYLELENTTVSSLLYTMVDGSRLVSSGHSMGGGISVLAAAQHPRFDAVLPISPYIIAPLFWAPNLPADHVGEFILPMQVIVGSADTTAVPALNADVVYTNGNCPKSEFTIIGADHSFSNPAHRALVSKYVDAWVHYYLERDGSYFDTLFGSGAQADQAAGLITYAYCLDTASVAVAPPSAVLTVGATQPFTATVRDRIGTIWPATVAWTTAGGIGSVDGTGLFTATASGSGTVTASRDGLQDSATVWTGISLDPTIVRARLTGAALADLTIDWGKTADDGAPGGPSTYRVMMSVSDPTGPFGLLTTVTADGSATYTYTCPGCGHTPGDTTPLFFRVEADAGLATRVSNLAARYAKSVVAGSNLLTVPLLQADDTAATVVQTLSSSISTLRTFQPADGLDPWKASYSGRTGDLLALPAGTGFWAELTTGGQYTVAGVVYDPTVNLVAGWNLVSYSRVTPALLGLSMSGIPYERVETSALGGDPYQLRAVGPTEALLWGEAYWVRSTTVSTWTQ